MCKARLSLSQLVHLLVPFRVGQSQQGDFMSQPCERQGNVRSLLDPVVESGEEEDIFASRCFFDKWFHLLQLRAAMIFANEKDCSDPCERDSFAEACNRVRRREAVRQ